VLIYFSRSFYDTKLIDCLKCAKKRKEQRKRVSTLKKEQKKKLPRKRLSSPLKGQLRDPSIDVLQV
jgi:hypothetical protein